MFTRRFTLVSVAGIKIGIDLSWFFIAILVTWTLAAVYFPDFVPHLSTGTYWIMGFIGMLGLFISVLLHELGHALVAKYYKIPISRITLFILGGLAEIEKEPETPWVEFLMAIAGPAVTLVLIGIFYGITFAGVYAHWPITVLAVLNYLAWFNLVIFVFNMIPAFPLDGGRVLRSILWGWKKSLEFATRVTTTLGVAFAYFLIFFGLFTIFSGGFISGIWLIILGIFMQFAAHSSRSQFYVGQSLKKQKVSSFMIKDPITVPPHILVSEFIENYLYQSHHFLYPVADEGVLLGTVSLKEVKALKPDEWKTKTVRDITIPLHSIKTLSPDTNAQEALDLMHQGDTTTFLVVAEGRLAGLLTAKDLFKVISLKIELENK